MVGVVRRTAGWVGASVLAVTSPPAATAPALPATGVAAEAVAYEAPVPLVVLHPFAPPATRFGAGNLGVDLLVAPHAQVHPAAAGVVRFAGSVAGRGLVVVQHADGVATEYEPLAVAVHTGDSVTGDTVLGRVRGLHRSSATPPCVPDRCLHWGARRIGAYLDPTLLLQPLGPVRLLPYP